MLKGGNRAIRTRVEGTASVRFPREQYSKGTPHVKPRTPEMIEGPEAWTRFQGAMKQVLSVPHAEIKRRIEAQKALAAKNPRKRGPKPKLKPAT